MALVYLPTHVHTQLNKMSLVLVIVKDMHLVPSLALVGGMLFSNSWVSVFLTCKGGARDGGREVRKQMEGKYIHHQGDKVGRACISLR